MCLLICDLYKKTIKHYELALILLENSITCMICFPSPLTEQQKTLLILFNVID